MKFISTTIQLSNSLITVQSLAYLCENATVNIII